MSASAKAPLIPQLRLHLPWLTLAAALAASDPAQPQEPAVSASAFNLEGSDARAVELAASVMERMGGQAAWDATRYLTWSFFDRRRHLWDKYTGDIRVEGTDRETGEPYLILMNLSNKRGRAWSGGKEVTEPEALANLLDRGEGAWINDSYWVFMPYKLRDPGVTLTYLGKGVMLDGRSADLLQLTFSEVGRTPENKYRVYVAKETGLVEQWDFYSQATDEEPRFQTPWHDWRPYGGILLSANRGESGHTGIGVLEQVPAGAFTSPEPIVWDELVPTPAEASGE